MDPDVCLRELRDALEVLKTNVANDSRDVFDTADTIITKIEALDGWLSRGGFLPKDWAMNRPKET